MPPPRRPLRRCLALLRAACPTRHPVHVRILDIPGDRWADYTRRRASHLIRLQRAASVSNPGLLCYVVLHEYAHALANEADPGEADDHGEAFGAAYARCCRAYSLE